MHDQWRDILLYVFRAGVAAVAPDGAVLRHLQLTGDELTAGGVRYALSAGNILVVGAGKGTAPMAVALENLLGERITQGMVVVKYDHGLPLKHIKSVEASHPVPDEAGVLGSVAMLEAATAAGKDDLVICLLTGGASALTPAPVEGVSLADLRDLTGKLLQSGATIHELNAVRKHLSRFSGGRLALAASPARVLTLLISDVVGDQLDTIASGPTAPDPSTYSDALDIITHYGLLKSTPKAVLTCLRLGLAGRIPETPKMDDPVFGLVQNLLVATNRQALEAAAITARNQGCSPRVLTDVMTGEASERARWLIREARLVADTLRPGDRPVCLLAGGETTVTIRGTGFGGRCQEMALTAALELEGENRVHALFAGTDGSDGSTDAAGAFAHGRTAEAIREHGDPRQFLENNDSYTALKFADDLLITGPTLTNVMDLAIVLVHG